MNTIHVKEEELNQHIPVAIPRPLQNNMITGIDMETLTCCSNLIQKFTKALHNLQTAQFRNQQEVNPKYPFVLQYSPNELIVHLGQNTVNLLYRQQLRQISSQMQLLFYPQKVIHSHRSLIRLSIQKRRQISIVNQKDSKNIPKNYCKAIITFALKYENLCLLILKDQSKVVQFLERISQYKKSQMNIRTFSSLLTESDDPEEEEFNKAFRILRYPQFYQKAKSLSRNLPSTTYLIQRQCSTIGIQDIDIRFTRVLRAQEPFHILRSYDPINKNEQISNIIHPVKC